MKIRLLQIGISGAALMASVSAAGQAAPESISAADPQSVAAAMRYAGYPVELKTDSVGDPMIETDFSGYKGYVYFYGCDKEMHQNCDSLQLTGGFDGDKPVQLNALNGQLSKMRFAAAWVDNEGDPWVQHDIVTLTGIPAPVFLKALDNFSWALGEIGDAFFQEQEK